MSIYEDWPELEQIRLIASGVGALVSIAADLSQLLSIAQDKDARLKPSASSSDGASDLLLRALPVIQEAYLIANAVVEPGAFRTTKSRQDLLAMAKEIETWMITA